MSGVKISIVTVAKNAAQLLPRCIKSVMEQSWPAVEYVLVDGASSDSTSEIARTLLRPTDKFDSRPDSGIYDAMNRGVGLATGDYVLFLGADDYLLDSGALSAAAAALDANDAPDMLYGGIEVRDPRGGKAIFHPPPPAEALEFMICGCLPHQATFAHRKMFSEKVGLFDLRYRVQSDYDCFLRALTTPGVSVKNFRRVVASFALGGASSRLRDSQTETYAIQNALPLYREPEWVEKRLHAFQKEALELRLEVQASRTSDPWRLKERAKRVLRRLAAVGGS